MDQPVSSNNPREVARNRFAEGERLLRFQQFTAAAAVFAEVGRLAPDVAAAPFNEGNAWFAAHQYAQAADAYRRSLAIEADPDAWNNLGNSLAALRQWADAASALRKATELNPRLPAAWSNLGKVMSQLGQPADALNCFLQAANLEPRNWRTLSNLAQIRAQQGAFEDALLSIQRACEVAPDIADVHVSRGGILRRLNRWRDARDAYQRALELAPNNPYVLSNLGELHRAVGEIESAKQYFAVALQDRQAPPETYDNFLLTLLYDDTIDADELWMQHRAWGELNQDVDNHTSAPAPVLGSAGERSEHVKVSLKPPADDRLLRIGYLSADFRLHPVGYLLEPVWQAHDRQRWQVVAYANSLILDQHTACLRELADEWHWVAHESDADLAERIRRDRIDILIDLSGILAEIDCKCFESDRRDYKRAGLGTPQQRVWRKSIM